MNSNEPSRQINLAVVTGSRAEFGLLEGIITLLHQARWCQLTLHVAGLHLDKNLGFTVEEVKQRFEVNSQVEMVPPDDSPGGMALAVARGLEGFTSVWRETQPDLILVLGDRTEPFAASLAAHYQGIPIAHIHGGDVSGDRIDDAQRDGISSLSQLHFAATEKSANRLHALSVEGDIHAVGAPGLDAIYNREPRHRRKVKERLELQRDAWMVLVQHSNPIHPDRTAEEIDASLEAVYRSAIEHDEDVVIIYPNNDAGHTAIIERLGKLSHEPRFHVIKNLVRDDYLDLLGTSSVLVGNSSSGVIESMALGVPAVDLGDRQQGRERDRNVFESEFVVSDILHAIDGARTLNNDASFWNQPSVYGDGQAGVRIVNAIEQWWSERVEEGIRLKEESLVASLGGSS